MKHFLLYYALLSKRFFKKLSFLLLLISIPLLTLGLKLVSRQDSGMLKIVLCAEEEDAFVNGLIRTLMEEKSVLQFVIMEDPEKAEEAVRDNQADAAWIFTEDFCRKLDFFSRYGYSKDVPVLVIEREDTIPLQLSKIKLFGILYPHVAYSSYLHFAKEELLPEETLSEEALREAYEMSSVEGSLFSLAYVDFEDKTDDQNYLTAPLRGLLSLMILLCGFAAAMFFYRDEERGMFERTPSKMLYKHLFIYEFAAMIPAATVSLAALSITEATGKLWWECLIMAAFLLDCSVFCSLIKYLLRSARILGASIPFLLLGMLVLCPIFFSYRGLWLVQILLPPYLYLNAAHNIGYFSGMLLHAAAIGTGLTLFFKKKGI